MAEFNWSSLISPALQAGASYWAGNQLGQAGQTAAAAADPFAQYRPQYANALAELQRNPSYVQNLPGYKFSLDQGQQALTRNMASKGYLGSGNMLAELQKQGQGFASQQFNTERDFLAKASGAYLDPSRAAQMGLNASTAQLGEYNKGLGTLGSALTSPTGVNALSSLWDYGKKGYDWLTGGLTGGTAGTAASADYGASDAYTGFNSPSAGGGADYSGVQGASDAYTAYNYGDKAYDAYSAYNAATGLGGVGGSGLAAAEMAALEAQAAYGLAGAGELALAGEGVAAGTAAAAGTGTAAAAGTGTAAAAGTGTAAAAGGAEASAGLSAGYAAIPLAVAIAMYQGEVNEDQRSMAGGSRTLMRLAEAGVPLDQLVNQSLTKADLSSAGGIDAALKNYQEYADAYQGAHPDVWATTYGHAAPSTFDQSKFMNYINSVPGAAGKLPGDIYSDFLGDVMDNAGGLGIGWIPNLMELQNSQNSGSLLSLIQSDPRFLQAWNARQPLSQPYDEFGIHDFEGQSP
jgi:hypothetical protein